MGSLRAKIINSTPLFKNLLTICISTFSQPEHTIFTLNQTIAKHLTPPTTLNLRVTSQKSILKSITNLLYHHLSLVIAFYFTGHLMINTIQVPWSSLQPISHVEYTMTMTTSRNRISKMKSAFPNWPYQHVLVVFLTHSLVMSKKSAVKCLKLW